MVCRSAGDRMGGNRMNRGGRMSERSPTHAPRRSSLTIGASAVDMWRVLIMLCVSEKRPFVTREKSHVKPETGKRKQPDYVSVLLLQHVVDAAITEWFLGVAIVQPGCSKKKASRASLLLPGPKRWARRMPHGRPPATRGGPHQPLKSRALRSWLGLHTEGQG
jgi:hypothetical protein